MSDNTSTGGNKELKFNLTSAFSAPLPIDLDQIPAVAILTRLADGLIIKVNNRFEIESGYSLQEVAGKTSVELELYNRPSDREKMIRLVKKEGRVDKFQYNSKPRIITLETACFPPA